MTPTRLNQFVEQIMKIEAGYAGMGGASSGIVGAFGSGTQMINSLRSNTIAFATAYVQPGKDRKQLTELSEQVEGSLYSIKLINGISDTKFEALVTELHTLLDTATTK